ncbi:MAG: BrnA antitoxin family protein [Candidatus Eisenbacteria bacterium]
MRAHYDFARMKGRKNPYVKLLKQSITIRLDRDTVEYFKGMAAETGLAYQNLINMYLRDCTARGRKLSARWVCARVGDPSAGVAANLTVSEPRMPYRRRGRRIRKPRKNK